MIPFNRYWIVFYQTLQDYSGGVALVEPNKMRKGLASSSHRLKPLCVHTQRLVSLCLCHPFLFSSSTHSRRWEEWTLHWTNEGHALWVLLIASHPSLPPLHFKSGNLSLSLSSFMKACVSCLWCADETSCFSQAGQAHLFWIPQSAYSTHAVHLFHLWYGWDLFIKKMGFF